MLFDSYNILLTQKTTPLSPETLLVLCWPLSLLFTMAVNSLLKKLMMPSISTMPNPWFSSLLCSYGQWFSVWWPCLLSWWSCHCQLEWVAWPIGWSCKPCFLSQCCPWWTLTHPCPCHHMVTPPASSAPHASPLPQSPPCDDHRDHVKQGHQSSNTDCFLDICITLPSQGPYEGVSPMKKQEEISFSLSSSVTPLHSLDCVCWWPPWPWSWCCL